MVFLRFGMEVTSIQTNINKAPKIHELENEISQFCLAICFVEYPTYNNPYSLSLLVAAGH